MFSDKVPMLAMISHSGIFAKVILIILVILSLISWTIIISKWLQLWKINRDNNKFIRFFSNYSGVLEWWDKGKNITKNSLFKKLSTVIIENFENINMDNIKNKPDIYLSSQFEITQSIMEQSVSNEIEKSDWGLTMLAVSSSISPFIGLLGTVWGITHSFYDIGSMGSTSINIVAPGIAEALITTIFGLIVAIPSVFFYNLFLKKIRRLETQLINFSTSLISDIKSNIISKLQ